MLVISLKGITLCQGMNSYVWSPTLKRIWRIGMRSENENTLNTAERMFITIDPATNFLYGET